MSPHRSTKHVQNSYTSSQKLSVATLLLAFTSTLAAAQAPQDIPIGATYVCNGERIFAESCNIRDTSDTSRCMMGHPDHVMPNGLMQYTYMTRGELKKLLPTCQQPSAKDLAAAAAFQKRQQDLYNANAAKAEQQMKPSTQAQQVSSYGQIAPPKNAEERQMRRCVSSGRLPASCTGNQLLGAFSQMLNSMVQITKGPPPPGPNMAGVFQGAGNWRLDFIDEGVLVNCSFLSPDQHNYSLDFKPDRTVLTIDTTPRPLVLTVHADGTITGPGPVTIDGVVPSGSGGGGTTPGHYESQQVTTHQEMNSLEAQTHAGESGLTQTGAGTYDLARTTTQSTYKPGTTAPTYTTFAHRRTTCPALNLTSKGASVGIQTMQTDLLKTMFGGDKGAPTPPGIRMHGIFASPATGFSLEFYPESVILGCGPDAARAYPYTVTAESGHPVIKIAAPDHPLTIAFKSDGSLEPTASGPYQVHGRIVTGQDNNDNFTFAPMERTCDLATLAPSKTIPSTGGANAAATMVASTASPAAAGAPSNPATLSTPTAPLGNAVLSIVSGFPTQPGTPNALAGRPYILLRDSYANALAKGGVTVPPGTSPYKYAGTACFPTKTPDCQKISDAIKASAASAVRADANGSGTLPGVSPGTYYLMISTRYNNQPLIWGQPIQLKPGPNSITLNQQNAAPLN